ncbi:Rha family transcriptional regulator [Alicyclobacillus sendaiensis]|uniref:Rha family transcriptional regulator n=1 Tax=Alicyclobacillus sendaiensis TaxID=192387 RepID=UPI0007865DED|nr:Rha family transcriptional regulator [Alicyclobacillus sendaiensis]
MAKLILNPEYRLYERNGQAFCSSRQIAEEFGRRHDHVLRTIDEITAPTSGVSEQFRLLNFEESRYKDASGRWNREFLLTKDGFVMTVMDFKGPKARAFKEAYIARFNAMEAFIRSLQAAKMEFPAFTEAVMNAHEEPKHYHFSNEINMIYRIVLGMDAKAFRQLHGLDKDAVIRPYLTVEQIQAIEALQRVDIGLLVAVPDYQRRKQLLQEHYVRIQRKRIA